MRKDAEQQMLRPDVGMAKGIGFLRRLLNTSADREGPWGEEALGKADAEELDRLVGVAMTVIAQEANAK